MSSTNKTTHYDLSQYTANDKPTYLVDYNSDMSAIDTGIYNAQTTADTNTNAIGTLSNLNTTEKTNLVGAINEVNTQVGTNTGNIGTLQTGVAANTGNIGTMANLDTTDKTSLVNAVNEVNELASEILKFNLGTATTLNYTSTDNISSVGQGSLSLSTNSDGSIFKLYGYLSGTAINTNGITFTFNSSLRPDADYTISNCIVAMSGGYLTNAEIKIKTTGVIEVGCWANGGTHFEIVLPACIYFNKNFGDQPNQ